MQFIPNTILGFFNHPKKSYEIPVYQRAYSWDKKNWTIFLEDLFEQLEGDNNYFYGNISRLPQGTTQNFNKNFQNLPKIGIKKLLKSCVVPHHIWILTCF